ISSAAQPPTRPSACRRRRLRSAAPTSPRGTSARSTPFPRRTRRGSTPITTASVASRRPSLRRNGKTGHTTQIVIHSKAYLHGDAFALHALGFSAFEASHNAAKWFSFFDLAGLETCCEGRHARLIREGWSARNSSDVS